MVVDLMAYLLILYKDKPIKITFKAKKEIAVMEFMYLPNKWEENGINATKKKKKPFMFEKGTSMFFTKTEAVKWWDLQYVKRREKLKT